MNVTLRTKVTRRRNGWIVFHITSRINIFHHTKNFQFLIKISQKKITVSYIINSYYNSGRSKLWISIYNTCAIENIIQNINKTVLSETFLRRWHTNIRDGGNSLIFFFSMNRETKSGVFSLVKNDSVRNILEDQGKNIFVSILFHKCDANITCNT